MDVKKLIANHIDCEEILGDKHNELMKKHTSDVTNECNGKINEEEIGKEIQRRLRIDAMWEKATKYPRPKLKW
jgi:hypothetical protein